MADADVRRRRCRSIAAFVIGFVPPSQFESGSAGAYVLLILVGTGLIGLLPAWLFLKFRKPNWKVPETAVAAATAAPEAPPASAATTPEVREPEPETPPPAPPEPEPEKPEPEDHHNRWMYWGIGAAVVVLIIVGLFAFSAAKNNTQAQQKAQQLEQKFTQLGLPVPASTNDIARSLGTDGGAVCANPANALGKATLNDMIDNGADFVGRRPVIIDRRILLGEAAILQTYCPEKAKAYQDKINSLKTRNTVKVG
jgi:hypothetical protein